MFIISTGLKAVLGQYKLFADLDRRSHSRGVYPTHYTLRTITARVKQDKEADTRVIAREERGHEGEKS